MKKFVLAVMMLVCMMSASVFAADAAEPVLLVIPVHYTMVQLANDIASLRQTYIVSYEKKKDGTVSMFVWDGAANDWVKTDIEAYKNGEIFAKPPASAFIIGADADVPASIVAATTFCEAKRIPSLNAAVIANTLNENLDFKKKEWNWLANRHKMQVVDLNEDRRHYGRYGKPGASKSDVPSNVKEMEEEIKTLPVNTPPEVKADKIAPKETAVPQEKQPAPEVEDQAAMDK